MKRILGILLVFQLATLAFAEDAVVPPASEITPEQMVFFETKVRPVFVEHCFKCHGEGKHKGNLQLDNVSLMLSGGDSGAAIVPGNPTDSLLIQAINYDGYEMPPGQKLPAEKIADLTRWVKMGAPWPGTHGEDVAAVRKGGMISEEDREWWAFQPITSPALPDLKHSPLPENPIDSFVLAMLEEQHLTPNPPADSRTLIRRAFFDLIGLPPTPEEMRTWRAALENSDGSIAQAEWARLIDDLLARPQYGERWGRHWLDVVRFAQTNGYERDNEKRYAWRYRDYVIAAFNSDKPYDQFVIEQLAGDELPDATDETRIATGFYRLGLWDDEPDDAQQSEFDDFDDIVVASSASFLGLTMGCARCHDHKFDPILHKDYYSLVAFFRNVRKYSNNENSPENSGVLPLGGKEKVAAAMEARAHRWAELDAKIAAAKDKAEKEKLQKARDNKTLPNMEWAMAVRERGPDCASTHILIRGNAQTPGDEVFPEFPEVLGGGRPEIIPPDREAPFQTSGRRLALAKWFVKPDHPLTARVMANRIWHYHFGRGIVPTTSDFGKVGVPPSHPQLLDWLASDFLASGWSVKQMHRRIMLSQTYQQSSATETNPQANAIDPGNVFLWRQNLHRLEAEAIRDSMLAISDSLNLEMGGRGFFPLVGAEVLSGGTVPGIGWESSSTSQRSRRSMYTFIKRSLVSPQLDTFDYANTSLPLTERQTTTVAPQALALLNDTFMHRLAHSFATRVEREAGTNPDARIQRAFEIALNRQPTAKELEVSRRFMDQQREEYAALGSRIMFRPIVPVSLHPSYLRPLSVEEFVDGPESDWTPFRGKWSNGGSLNTRQGPVSLWEGMIFQDASLSTTITLGNASELAGLFLRASPAGDFVKGYEILLDPREATLSIVRHSDKPVTIASIPAVIPTGVPLQLVGSINGNKIAVQLKLPGADVKLEAVDPDPIGVPGKLGARTWGAAVTLDGLALTVDGQTYDVANSRLGPESSHQSDSSWVAFDSDWKVNQEGAVTPVPATAGGKLIWNHGKFEDGVVEADVRVRGGGDAGLILRVTDPYPGVDSLVSYNINFSKNRLRLGKHNQNWRELVQVPCEFPADRWVHVRAELNGPHIRVYVDHHPEAAIDYTDPEPLAAGKVGFRTFNCPIEFRNVTLTGTGGTQTLELDSLQPASQAQVAVTGLKPDQSEQQAFESFCLLVLNLNELIYVE